MDPNNIPNAPPDDGDERGAVRLGGGAGENANDIEGNGNDNRDRQSENHNEGNRKSPRGLTLSTTASEESGRGGTKRQQTSGNSLAPPPGNAQMRGASRWAKFQQLAGPREGPDAANESSFHGGGAQQQPVERGSTFVTGEGPHRNSGGPVPPGTSPACLT